MKIYLLRHGETEYNAEKRYQGARDIPLSAKGRAELVQADFSPARVFVSPLIRTRQTAEILFPKARQIVVDDLREMCFGRFEGRNYIELEQDADYRAWISSNCESACPDGEQKAQFSARVCAAFHAILEKSLESESSSVVIVAHGGTQMAVMERYALPHRNYYHWCGPNGGGYVLKTQRDIWHSEHTMKLIDTVQYLHAEDAVCKF